MKKNAILIVLFFFAASAFGQDFKYVNADKLNIRENPGKQFSVVGKINNGDKVRTLSESNGWTEIETENGIKGFVATEFLSSSSQSEHNDSPKENTSWLSIFIGLCILGYAAYKIINFFSGSSVNSKLPPINMSSSSTFSSASPKTIPNQKTSTITNFYCEYCGSKASTVSSLTRGTCVNHPDGRYHGTHKLYEGGEKSKYFCKYCGANSSTISSLVRGNCVNHPKGRYHGTHSPAI